MSQQASTEKPELGNYIRIRFRNDGVVAWTLGDGNPVMGVRSGPKTTAMLEAIKAAYDEAVPLKVEL
jgi:hypothetical protein